MPYQVIRRILPNDDLPLTPVDSGFGIPAFDVLQNLGHYFALDAFPLASPVDALRGHSLSQKLGG